MANIKVCSMLQNSMRYDLHELYKDDKGILKAKARNYYLDDKGKIISIDEIPPFKTIIIEGRHPYFKRTKLMSPFVMNTVETKDWEHIKQQYHYTCEIKNGLIFANKNDMETLAQAECSETQSKKTGTDPLTPKDLVSGAEVITS